MQNQGGARGVSELASQVFATLEQVLSVQTAALERLVELGEAKKSAILDDHPEKLEGIAESEMKALRELQEAEQRRSQIVGWLEEQVSKAVGQDVRMTLSNLVTLAPVDWKEKLKALEQRLRKASVRLEQLSDLNRRLLTHSLAVVNLSLEVLTGEEAASPIYERSGKSGKPADGVRLVDAEA